MTTGNLFTDSEFRAQFSPCRNWRYSHEVQWADDGPMVAFLLFNPSTADETTLDPTLRKCRGFAQRWGYSRMVILNLFAIRGTDPRTPAKVHDPVGPMNDYYILQNLKGARELICAWGCGQHFKTEAMKRRPLRILSEVRERWDDHSLPIRCLGLREDKHPRHPLMLSYDTERVPFGLNSALTYSR